MLDKARADELVDGLDLDGINYCPCCVFEIAWDLRNGCTPHWQSIGRVAVWTWQELEASLLAALLDARMREVRFAEAGLRDVNEHGPRTAVARAVVLRIAGEMAEEMAER
jgi:hypothetical protein